MDQEAPVEDALSLEEFNEVLAEATGMTPEEIERGADKFEIAPPEEATVVDGWPIWFSIVIPGLSEPRSPVGCAFADPSSAISTEFD